MPREVISVVISAGVAGFFWGAVLYEGILGNWGRVGVAVFAPAPYRLLRICRRGRFRSPVGRGVEKPAPAPGLSTD
jgi:hypothetical protein